MTVMCPQNAEDIHTLRRALIVFISSAGTLSHLTAAITLVVGFEWYAGWQVTDVFFVVLVFVTWSLPEWWLHKYPMHNRKLRFLPERFNVLYRMHMAHHRDPGNMDHALLKVGNVLLAGVILALLSGLLLWSLRCALLSALGFYLIALNYNFVHFLSHTSVDTDIPLLRQSLVNHRMHHAGNQGGYCLSNIWMDCLMGTLLREGESG